MCTLRDICVFGVSLGICFSAASPAFRLTFEPVLLELLVLLVLLVLPVLLVLLVLLVYRGLFSYIGRSRLLEPFYD